ARDIAQARDLARGAGADDDVGEILFVDQAALGIDRNLEVRPRRVVVRHGRRAELTGGNLDVLLADRAGDIADGQAARGDFFRIEPDAHRIVAAAELLHVADTVDLRQLVLDVQGCVVRQISLVVAAIGRGD